VCVGWTVGGWPATTSRNAQAGPVPETANPFSYLASPPAHRVWKHTTLSRAQASARQTSTWDHDYNYKATRALPCRCNNPATPTGFSSELRENQRVPFPFFRTTLELQDTLSSMPRSLHTSLGSWECGGVFYFWREDGKLPLLFK